MARAASLAAPDRRRRRDRLRRKSPAPRAIAIGTVEISVETSGLSRLDIGLLDHPAPQRRFIGEEFRGLGRARTAHFEREGCKLFAELLAAQDFDGVAIETLHERS